VSKTCPRCGGGGRVPLSATEQAVFQRLRFEVSTLAVDLVEAVGVSHQRIDGALTVLEREGLARRLPRTVDGYEWLAASDDREAG
jgi:TRAP-type mannitol/chloroaromatic compound transport system substrate-binding protein